jgi:hypothetical protein
MVVGTISAKKFGGFKKKQYLCRLKRKKQDNVITMWNSGIAECGQIDVVQLLEQRQSAVGQFPVLYDRT